MQHRKSVVWIGSARNDLLSFPEEARRKIGHQLNIVQNGGLPDDWKIFAAVGPGAMEIRVHVDGNQFRTLYVARFDEAIYVLHCFAKKEQRTATKDVDVAKQRYKLMNRLRSGG